MPDELRPGPSEPAVTAEESEVLRRAAELHDSDPDAAFQLLRDAVDADSSAALPFAMGGFLVRQGRHEAARTAFRDSLRRMPSFARARRNLAMLQLEHGQYRRAAAHLQILLADPASDRAEIWKMLAHANLMSGEARAAEAAYRTAMALNPDDPEARRGLIQARVKMQEVADARGLILEELEREPASRDLWMLLAADDLRKDNSFEALVRLDCVRRLGMASASSLMTEGNLLLQRGLVAEAGERFLSAADGAATDPVDLVAAARGLLSLGETDAASQLVERIEAAGQGELPADVKADLGLLRVALAEKTQGLDTALQVAERALRRFPMNGPLLLRTGWLHQRNGAPESALTLYERASRVDDADIRRRALVRRAQLAVEQGQYRVAEDRLVQALEIRHADYIQAYLDQIRQLQE